MVKLNGKLVILGCGSVAQCVLSMLFEIIEVPKYQIVIIDAVDNRNRLDHAFKYIVQKITPENYDTLLSKYLCKGDFLLDLSVDIETKALIEWCSKNEVLFVNTSIEEWNLLPKKNIKEQTLYMRRMELKKLTDNLAKSGPTAIIEHGANPGLVSHFAKKALIDIAKTQNLEISSNFALLAYKTGVKVIHVSEIDTQVTSVQRKKDEFVNTWSCSGFIEEAIAPAELGFGTHEKVLPEQGIEHDVGPKHQIFLNSKGCQSYVRSWLPSGEIKGMVIRHGEAYTLCEALTLKKNDITLYRPTIHYAYKCCPDAIASLKELEEKDWAVQKKMRILEDEIEEGSDELGCLLMGQDSNPWWIGSILDIQSARYLAPRQNATTVQVAIGVIAAMAYAIEHPNLGVLTADDLDHEYILNIAMPYLGTFISAPLKDVHLKESDLQFTNLLFKAPK